MKTIEPFARESDRGVIRPNPDSTVPAGALRKRSYVSPELRNLGDIRSWVMSPSPGIAESGLGQGFKA